MDTEIEEAAAYAARLIVDQHCSWALARTKLTEAFGKRCPMPSGADVETAVREHLSIFYPDHPALLAALRAEAAAVMRNLAEAGITAYLAGPVLNARRQTTPTSRSNASRKAARTRNSRSLISISIGSRLTRRPRRRFTRSRRLGGFAPSGGAPRSLASSPSRTQSAYRLKCCRFGISARTREGALPISTRPISRPQAARHSTTSSACCATPHIIRINLFLRIRGFPIYGLSLTIAVGDF